MTGTDAIAASDHSEPEAQPLLALRGLTMQFGGLTAVNQLDLEVRRGEILALIGPNGAGKTTVFNMITGVYTPTGGDIRFAEQSIAGLLPHKITRLGDRKT